MVAADQKGTVKGCQAAARCHPSNLTLTHHTDREEIDSVLRKRVATPAKIKEYLQQKENKPKAVFVF